MKNTNKIAIILSAFMALGLSACETMPKADRAALFEKTNRDLYVGKNADNLVINLGPPTSSYPLSDGRKILQYEVKRTETHSYGSTIMLGTGFGHYHNRGHVAVAWPFFSPFYDPVTTTERVCIRRFLLTSDNFVEDFKWEGNACF